MRLQPHGLPAPRAEEWQWQTLARCRGMDSAIFFTCDDESRRGQTRREAKAKQLCAECPVLRRCRDHALDVGEAFGIWGGLSASERAALHSRTDLDQRRSRDNSRSIAL